MPSILDEIRAISNLCPKRPLHPSHTILVDLTLVIDELSYEYDSPEWLEDGKMHIHLKWAGRTEASHRMSPVFPREHSKSGGNKLLRV